MKFPYKRFNPPKDGPLASRKYVSKPILTVILVSPDGRKFGYECLADSGADICLFDAKLGEAMGLDVKAGPPGVCHGIGGQQPCYYHVVEVEIGGWRHRMTVGFAYNYPASFGLLGRHPLFEIYKPIFDDIAEELELKERKK